MKHSSLIAYFKFFLFLVLFCYTSSELFSSCSNKVRTKAPYNIIMVNCIEVMISQGCSFLNWPLMFAFFVSKELEGDPANQMPVSDTFFRSIPYGRYGTHRRFICRTVGSATNEDCYLENSSVSRDGFFLLLHLWRTWVLTEEKRCQRLGVKHKWTKWEWGCKPQSLEQSLTSEPQVPWPSLVKEGISASNQVRQPEDSEKVD